MAKDIRSLVVDEGITKQIGNDDTLQVGVGIKPSTGTDLSIGAADTDVTVPGSMTIDGDLDVQGAIGVVSTTTFQQDATFLGNVSFGDPDAPVDDTVSFANATISSDINFDGLGHKITNLAAPTDDNDAARKVYVDDGLDLKLDLTGGTMSGAIAMGSSKITGLANGTDANDAVNKSQLDAIVSGVSNVTATAPLSSTEGPTPDISLTGIVPVANGGTGSSLPLLSFGSMLYADSTSSLTSFPLGPFGYFMKSNGGTPTWDQIQFTDITGTLAVEKGGTGVTSLAANGALVMGFFGTQVESKLGSSAGDVLTWDGTTWAAAAPSVTSAAGSNTEIQFNSSGAFGASAAFTFNSTTTELLVGGGTAHTIKIAPLGAFNNPLIESDDSMNINIANFGGALGLQTGGTDLVLVGGDDGGGMSYLQTQDGVRLETKGEFWMAETATLPTGVASTGKLAAKSNALYFVDATGQAHYTMPDGLLALSGTSVELDFDPELPSYRDLPLSGNTTFSTAAASLVAGRSLSIRLDNSAGGSARVLTFPNTSGTPKWTWLGGSPPAQVDAGDVAVISLMCYGTTDESIVAAWSYSESVQITGGGTAGQIAYFDGTRTITSEGGLAWNANDDQLNIGNADNTAHSANLRVGGSAHIGGAVWLDGNVDLGDASGDVITVNGAMSLASGASFSGVSGTVTLPTQFSIGTGNAVSANVTAANLNTLTGGGDTTLHSHGSMVIDNLSVAGGGATPAQYDACYISANDTIAKGDQTDAAKSVIAGIRSSASAGVIVTSGRVAANFVSGLAGSLAGKPCFLAGGANAGKLTTVAPTSGVLAEIGVVLSDANYGTAGTCSVSLAIKPTIQLV